jgi:glycosyltransferase involved in cell wall biosynthesis
MTPDRSQPRGANLWVDVSSLHHHKGVITGIPRTVSQFVEALEKKQGLRLRLCAFSATFRFYREIPRKAVQSTIPGRADEAVETAPPPTAGALPTMPRREPGVLRRLLPTDLRFACQDAFSAARYLRRFVTGCCGRVLTKAIRTVAKCVPRGKLGKTNRLLFAEGDVLFIPGSSWDHGGALEVLAEIKRTRHLMVVPLVYDVIPDKLPQTCNPRQPGLFGPWIHKLLNMSALIATISHNSRRDVLALAQKLSLSAPPVEVIRLGDAPTGFDRPVRPRNLPGETKPFALSVGTLETRKNHWLLYHVWRRLIENYGERIPPLVLAGRAGWGTADLLQHIQTDPLVRNRIIPLFAVSDDELSWLYRHCQFTLYPSHYEGWGLPVAESLAYGKHCICSNTSSLPEVGGALVDYHDPLDAMQCLDLVRRAVFEPGYLQEREARIQREYRAATWTDCGARLVPLLERALNVQLTEDPLWRARASGAA